MEEYIKVDVNKYVKEGLEDGILIPREAEKFARIIAKQGKVGDKVITWSVDGNGNAIIEKESHVKLDEKTSNPGWIVTKATEAGEPIVDQNGKLNQWIIEDSIFTKKYEQDPQNPSICRPKGGVQIFVEIPNNIILNQWGSDMKIAEGGFINITNVDDMYGISKRDFEDTYKFTDEVPARKLR